MAGDWNIASSTKVRCRVEPQQYESKEGFSLKVELISPN